MPIAIFPRVFRLCRYWVMVGRDSSVDTATRYGLDGPGIESRWGRDFPHPSRPVAGPWYRVSFPGVKRPGRGVDHPSPSNAAVKERVELYLFSPCGPSWPVVGWPLPLPLPLPSPLPLPLSLLYLYIYLYFTFTLPLPLPSPLPLPLPLPLLYFTFTFTLPLPLLYFTFTLPLLYFTFTLPLPLPLLYLVTELRFECLPAIISLFSLRPSVGRCLWPSARAHHTPYAVCPC